jgi:hypothetical protein
MTHSIWRRRQVGYLVRGPRLGRSQELALGSEGRHIIDHSSSSGWSCKQAGVGV